LLTKRIACKLGHRFDLFLSFFECLEKGMIGRY
jgi:hypothetical protein